MRSVLGGMQSIVMSMFVCLSVRSHNSKTTQQNFTKVFVHVACARGSVILNSLCTSGFVDDVMFAHNRLSSVSHMYQSRVLVESVANVSFNRFSELLQA